MRSQFLSFACILVVLLGLVDRHYGASIAVELCPITTGNCSCNPCAAGCPRALDPCDSICGNQCGVGCPSTLNACDPICGDPCGAGCPDNVTCSETCGNPCDVNCSRSKDTCDELCGNPCAAGCPSANTCTCKPCMAGCPKQTDPCDADCGNPCAAGCARATNVCDFYCGNPCSDASCFCQTDLGIPFTQITPIDLSSCPANNQCSISCGNKTSLFSSECNDANGCFCNANATNCGNTTGTNGTFTPAPVSTSGTFTTGLLHVPSSRNNTRPGNNTGNGAAALQGMIFQLPMLSALLVITGIHQLLIKLP